MDKRSTIVTLVVTTVLVPTVHGAVIDFQWHQYGDPSKSTHTCSFDYGLQQFTIVDTIYELDFMPYMHLSTFVDSPSTFSVVKTVVNNTGLTWTGYGFSWGGPLLSGSPAMLDRESVKSTKLQTITYPYDWTIDFAGSPVVLGAESFTIEFDLCTSEGIYHNVFSQSVIPEPTTLVLLGLGWLALFRTCRLGR